MRAQVASTPSVWALLLTHCVKFGSEDGDSPPVLEWVLFTIEALMGADMFEARFVRVGATVCV